MALLTCCDKDDYQQEKKDGCVVTFEINRVCGCDGVAGEIPSPSEYN